MFELLRVCDSHFTDGPTYGVWSSRWSHSFDSSNGKWGPAAGKRGQHGGQDIMCPEGTPLVAPIDGVVLMEGWQDPKDKKKGWGLRIIIVGNTKLVAFDNQIVYPYITLGHLSQIFVCQDTRVKRGKTIIGLSGMTGAAVTPHVHVQLENPKTSPRTPMPFDWVVR